MSVTNPVSLHHIIKVLAIQDVHHTSKFSQLKTHFSSDDSINFFQGVPQQAQITQFNKKKILYIDNNNNKKTGKYIKFTIAFYEFSYFEIVA